ncbi:MAG TPA: hypothetical protein VGO64_11000 [Candidatus Limnocylindrales bacterium]|nr:hypothetical protein [Candidatus Limnocylindrales bacterium]
MLVKPIQRRGEPAAVRAEPVIDLTEWLDVEAVHASLAVGPRDDEPCIAKDPQMLRDGRLTQPRPIDELTHRRLAIAEAIQDLAPMRLGEDGEGIQHDRI